MSRKSSAINVVAIDLFTKKYAPKTVKPRKGKGSYSRKGN